MSDIFDRAASRAVDKLRSLNVDIHKTPTLAYQWLAVILRGEYHKEHGIAQNDDLSIARDTIRSVMVRHKDAVPEWQILGVMIEESLEVPVTEYWIMSHDGTKEVHPL